jgi:glycerol-3-phosphate O-acyltransferase
VISSLGGYCLDRAQAARLYKELVVEYSALLIEEDCHSLVFPSGTRSRSGKVESKLKLGLLGSTLRAQRYRLQRGIAAPVYIVPVTINHLVVPEAQLLIQYELEGRQKERVVGDEMRNQGSPGSFAKRVLGFEEHMSLCFGEALSPIGEAKGQPLVLDAEPSPGDMQHTRRLGTSIARAFLSGTRFYSTHVVARALYDLEGTTAHTSIDETMVLAAIDSAKQLLMRDASQGSLMDSCVAATPRHLLQEATRSWNRCHQAGVLRCDAGKVSVLSPALLLYYQNRSAHISN